MKFALPLAAFLACLPAHAASFSCTGGILDYAFRLSGNISGARISGSAKIVVTKGGSRLQRGSAPASGSFAAGTRLSVVTQDTHARIAVDAAFSGGNYVGPMQINSDQGNTSVTATCTVR